MVTDTFRHQTQAKRDPYTEAEAVTPSDTVDLDETTRALYIGGTGSGALKVDMQGGKTVTFVGLLVNTILPIRVNRVYATGTDVTNIVALW